MKYVAEEPQQRIDAHLQQCKSALILVGMGVGKTAAILTRLSEMIQNAEVSAALVIAPLRVCNLTWPLEIKQWDHLKWMKVANLRTESGQRAFLNGTAHVYLINYESIPLLVSLVERRRNTIPYQVAIFDELTKAKNPSSKRIKIYRKKVPRPEWNWGATGTPMPNSWRDLFAQARLVDNGKRLGEDYRKFLQEFFYCTTHGGFPKYEEKAGTAARLEKALSDITITIKSSDVLNIPDTVFEDVEVTFTPELKEKYKTLERELVIEIRKQTERDAGKRINVGSAAALVTKLQQFTSGEMYCDEKKHHPIHDLKFKSLEKLIKQQEEPMFVVCQFKHEYSRMKEFFPHSKFFNDAKTIQAQTQLLSDWNKKKIPILFAHPASVGHGLNMQFGSSILTFLSLTYNREHYDQIICRFARRGQTEVTKVYRLMVPGTVDDAVASVLETKAKNEARLISALQLLESYRTK